MSRNINLLHPKIKEFGLLIKTNKPNLKKKVLYS